MSKLFVYGINRNCPNHVLREEFERCGGVEDVYITEKGYAFVTMNDEEGAENAIRELNGKEIDGQPVKVDAARKREGGGGGGGYGGPRRGGFGGGRGGGGRGRGGGGFGGSRGCYNCGGDGHIARECPEQRRESRGGGGGYGGGGYGRRDY